ncbi:MAG TPA: transglycosylase domain-containing protein, partial [Thermoanaerobaculia bacterium]|nr:transglycosylase domain-containing protein [Thermoanaerobaculia bacterium]
MSASRRPARTRLAFALVTLVALPFALDRIFPFPEAKLHRPSAIVVYDRDGAPLRIILPPDGKVRIPIALDELPPELVRAVVASEDRWFWRHPGVNPIAVARAAWSNARARRRVSGASTIPMQIARLTRPRRRTIFAKAVESFRAVQLTAHHSKRELLEIYLNLAPYGGNVEGIGAASQVYFGKDPSRLSIGEVAFLTTLPRSPNRYDPLRDHAAATRARDRVLGELRARGTFSAAEIAAASKGPLPRERRRAPFIAPHFCDYAVQQATGRARVYTTLD